MDDQPVPATGAHDAAASEAGPFAAVSDEARALPTAAEPTIPAPAPFAGVGEQRAAFPVPPQPAIPPAGPFAGVGEQPPVLPAAPQPTPVRRSRRAVAAIWLLAVALVLAVGAGAWLAVQFVQAQEQIERQQDRISEQNDEIEHQKELIDKKETFGAAMAGLMDTAAKFDGVLTASVVPWHEYEVLARRGWAHRWDAVKMTADTQQVDLAADELETVWTTAQQEAATNATGSTYEAVIDRLGAGFVRSAIDDDRCSNGDDGILGCVFENEPYLVHFDAAADARPFMTDELRTGIAYHEFAHVLQFTNPAALDSVLPAFDGDFETMADCFALTFLDGWTLDHRIWVSSYEYWDVSIGYGHVCSEPQRQAVRDWYAQLGVRPQTLGGDAPS